MSSHHIVRENQEPALIMASIDALDEENVGQLLEWSPTILTNDHTLDFLLARGIKVDVLFTAQQDAPVQEQIKLQPIAVDFIVEALEYLVAHHYKAVNVVCDSVHPAFFRFAASINLVVFAAGKRMAFVQHDFEKWKPKGERIYVEESRLKSLVGLRKVTDDVFETEQDGFFYLGFNTDDFVIVAERV